MNSQARIEHHHDLQESRAAVYSVEAASGVPLPAEHFDRAVMLQVEHGGTRCFQPRPRKTT